MSRRGESANSTKEPVLLSPVTCVAPPSLFVDIHPPTHRPGKSRSVSSRQDGLKCRPAAIINNLTFFPGSSRWFRELCFVGIGMVVAVFQQGAFINIKGVWIE